MGGIADFRLPIADCGWTLEGDAPPLFQSSIVNQESALESWSLAAAKGGAAILFPRFFVSCAPSST
jgi:hypothetical protein